MQKACFTQAQHLPCQLVGYTACNDVIQDVREISVLFGINLDIGVEAAADAQASIR